MAERKRKEKAKGFTAEERSAMRERAQELKAGKADGESAVLAKIAELSEPDRTMANRLHQIVRASAPALTPRLWYGMPAYARTERSSASSKARRSSRRGTRRSASATERGSTKERCGRARSR